MDTMDQLFEVYKNVYFAQLEHDVRRHCGKLIATRLTRQEFEKYISDPSRDTESKRLLLNRLLDGREHLSANLPEHLQALAKRAA